MVCDHTVACQGKVWAFPRVQDCLMSYHSPSSLLAALHICSMHPCLAVSKHTLTVLMAFVHMQHLTGVMDFQSHTLQPICWPGRQLASISSPGLLSLASERALVSLLQVSMRTGYSFFVSALASFQRCVCGFLHQCFFSNVRMWLLASVFQVCEWWVLV